MEKLNIPSPDEVIEQAQLSSTQGALIISLVDILNNKFSGGAINVPLYEILSGVDKSKILITGSDRGRMELMMQKARRKVSYKGSAEDDGYSYYRISKNNV